MAAYGGYYTRQEQEDAMAARIDNPNRVGSGFINLGPMQRQPPQASSNWQTSSLIGGGGVGVPAPQGVSDIWNTPQPPQQPRAPQQPAPPMGAPPGMAARYGVPDQNGLHMGFQNLGMNSGMNSAAPAAAMHAQQTFGGLGGFGGLGDHRNFAPPQPPQPQAPSLTNLLPPPPSSAGLSSAFGMGNGGQPSRQAFANTQIPQMPQMPPQPIPLQNNGMHSSAFSSGAFAPPAAAPPPRQQAAAPRALSSAADYAAAAQVYKPPVPPRGSVVAAVSVSRAPEVVKKQQPARQPAHQPAKEEWECPRCTFLNNIALRECEMCAFEHVGRDEAPAPPPAAPSAEEDGWHTAASAAVVRKTAPAAVNAALAGKSKAQSKNEKRRAKKRGDGY